jgi:hypothetical protein
VRLSSVTALLLLAACQDLQTATDPAVPSAAAARIPEAARARFNLTVPEVLALPGTVFGDLDESTGQLVFGVENTAVIRGVRAALVRLGIPASSYTIRVTEPIRFAADLQDAIDPKVGGLQIHFSRYVCSLGFNADHAGGRSFVTASHCSDRQAETEGTAYYQPLSSVAPTPIAFEADDPSFFKGGVCSMGRKCRYSDAARALYQAGVANNGEIARTSGPNNGSLEIVGTFDVTSQDHTTTEFPMGLELNKVGRATGWTQGTVVASCATVNVFASNIQLHCQTLVERSGATLVGSGDSGSNVFALAGANAAQLVGLVWGSSGSDTFIFSPLSGVVAELGSLDATTDGAGGEGGGGGGGPNCPPRSRSPNCPQ